MPLTCPACGFKNPDRAKFCNECGAALGPKRERPRGLRHARTTERRHATVLFADIQGYTSLSAQIDPEELHEIMDPIYATMARAVTAHGGLSRDRGPQARTHNRRERGPRCRRRHWRGTEV